MSSEDMYFSEGKFWTWTGEWYGTKTEAGKNLVVESDSGATCTVDADGVEYGHFTVGAGEIVTCMFQDDLPLGTVLTFHVEAIVFLYLYE